jgi:5-methylcytosine-specific restriction protein A
VGKIPKGITAEDISGAIRRLNEGEAHGFGECTGYDILFEGKRYPPKAVVGLAASRLRGEDLGPYDFKGGCSYPLLSLLRA